MNRYDIIKRPLITEQSMDMMADNKYSFVVEKDDIKTLVKIALRGKKKIKFDKPVEIEMQFNSRLDVSNHAYIFKMIEDVIKERGIIEDDTDKYVKKCVMQKQYVFDGVIVCVKEYKD